MKSIQNQYIDLKEGRMSQANFMRNVRMTLPQYVTNVTSFKDTVRILKNKAILNENLDAKDEEDDEFIDMIARAEEEEAGKYTKNYDFPGGLGEGNDEEEAPEDYEDPDMFDAYGMDASEGLKTVKEPNPNAGKWRLMSIDGKRVLANDFFDSEKDAKEYARKNVRTDYKTVKLKDERSVYRNIDEGRKKKEPKTELHPNQIHPQELRMGIKVELEHTDDLDKAKKIALDHLAENPFYYTALKLSGIESPSAPKVKPPVAFKKEVTAAVELVDKVNAMQKVKMPKVVKENLNEGGEWTITGTLTKEEQDELKNMIGDYDLDVQATDDTLETTISHPMYNDKSLEHALKQVRGMLPQNPSFRPGVDLGKYDLKSMLEKIVHEVLDEMYDGRDDMNAQNEY
jgi:hypothetical protein